MSASDLQIGSVYSDLDMLLNKNNAGSLKIVTDNDSVEQSINTILLTPVGSRVMLRDFGSRLGDLVFEPLTVGTAIKIRNEIRRAINRWDPRLVLTKVNATINGDDSIFYVEIEGYVSGLSEFTYSRILTRD